MRTVIIAATSIAILTAILFTIVRIRTPPEAPRTQPLMPAPSTSPETSETHRTPETPSEIRLNSIPSDTSGIHFKYYGNPSEQHYMTEQNGGGIALFDADGDGQLDVFLVNGSHFERSAESAGATNRLYRQSDPWKFEDVTLASGLQAYGFGQGCAAGDFDNDGFSDLFVACYGMSRLWHNNGDGTFTDVTLVSGIHETRWATSAAFADLDGDGNLDLYVVNYVDWSPDKKTSKRIPSPMDFDGLPDHLYRNSGNGDFREIGSAAGISLPHEGKGLALAIGDFDGDYLPDIYVANDTTRNFLFKNLGGMKFEERGIISGCAVSQDGSIGSSMGVAVGDYNRDGLPDLFVTNFAEELLDAFTGIGQGGFVAHNRELGIDRASKHLLKFGIGLADFDADGWPDLFVANGHLWDDPSPGWRYRMPPNLLRNLGGKRFVEVAPMAGEYFQQQWLGRAVACGDLDNDGDPDLVISHLLDPATLLRNDSRPAGNVLRLKLIGTQAARQPFGTRIEVTVAGRVIVAHVPAGESFQVSHDDRVLIPIGDAVAADEVRVVWSADQFETWTTLPVGKLQWLRQGTGDSSTAPSRNTKLPK